MSMRRLMAIAAFALFLAVPAWAQHGGGGHGGGGGHASFGGGHSGFSGGRAGFSSGHAGNAVHSLSGARSAPGFSRSISPSARAGFSRGPFLHDGFRGRDRFDHRGRPGWGFRNNCRGYGCWGYGYGYPWYGAGYYDPWLWDWWNSDSSYDQDYDNNLAIANEMNEQSLAEQQMWRQEESDGDQDVYAPRSNSSQPAPSTQRPAVDPPSPIIPPTVLIFRDQHQQEIQNYAIVGQTLWNFAAQRKQKIPLADLDLAATQKANDDRGVTFRLPLGSEGQ